MSYQARYVERDGRVVTRLEHHLVVWRRSSVLLGLVTVITAGV